MSLNLREGGLQSSLKKIGPNSRNGRDARSLELAFAGSVPFSVSAPAMLGTHAVIGAGEALITVLAFSLLQAPATASRKSAWIPAVAAVLIALLLSPFASPFPDGLEWVAGKLGFLHESGPAFVAPLAEYSLPGSLPAFLSAGLAGLAGVLVVFVLGCVTSLAWKSAVAMNVWKE
ncbi:MAG: PDGLE domain-containing protein [Terrimicrobiaceae bacterium]